MSILTTIGSWEKPKNWQIKFLDYWNMSIASMMMEEMLEMIRNTSLEILDLEVRSDNRNAIKLYKKFHFQEIGQYPQMFKINDHYYDAILMNLYL